MSVWYLNPKLYAGLALVWFGFWLYGAGYDKALADAYELQRDREVELTANFTQAIAERERRRDEALAQVDELLNRPPVVLTNEGVRIVKENRCDSFSPDMLGLLNGTGAAAMPDR